MPSVIVTCIFNPPEIMIQGAPLRQDTIAALEKSLAKGMGTSMPSSKHNEIPKFEISTRGSHRELDDEKANAETNAEPKASAEGEAVAVHEDGERGAKPKEAPKETYVCLKMDLRQHYCDQDGRSRLFMHIMEHLEEEGFALRGSSATVGENDKDISRMSFVRN